MDTANSSRSPSVPVCATGSGKGQFTVARVLDDGPTPMGPFVYLQAATRSVKTLLCRCMPSQAEHFVADEYYQLLPIDYLSGIGVERLELLSRLLPAALDRLLRLPDDF